MHPVVELVLGVAHAFFALSIPNAVGTVASSTADDVTNFAFVDPLDRFDVIGLPPVLGSGNDGGLVRSGLFVGFETLPVTCWIHASRLFSKNMFPSVNRVQYIRSTESRRRGEQHDVDIFVVEHSFVSVQTVVHIARFDVELVGVA